MFDKTILLVDDEQNILNALRRLFYSSDMKLLTASSGLDALGILENNHVDMILSDYKMPQMNGVELLTEVKNKYPHVFRAILSGYIETDTIINAIGSGIAMVYFKKPWSDYSLTEKVEHVFNTLEFLKNDQLLEVVNRIKKLPSIPETYIKIESAISEGKSIDNICDIIKEDISLAAKILQIGNSVLYGAKEYSNLKQAVTMMGLEAAKSIILMFKLTEENENINKEELSRIFTNGLILNRCIEHYFFMQDDNIFRKIICTSGLLSCIGKVILLSYFPDRYNATVKHALENKISFTESEIELGYADVSNLMIASHFLDLYNMPYDIVSTILNCSDPSSMEKDLQELGAILNCLINVTEKYVYNKIIPDNIGCAHFQYLSIDKYEDTIRFIREYMS